jgi:diphthine-ammonia ligase
LKVAVLFSGGKDSTYATWVAQHQGWDIATLVSIIPKNVESMMFHYPDVKWTKLQAQALGLPHHVLEAGKDELLSLKEGLAEVKQDLGINGVVTGAVASDYQRSRIDRLCDDLSLKSFAPLWHKDPRRLIDDLKLLGLKIMMIGVGAGGLDESWLGKELTDDRWAMLETLSMKHGIHLTGEGGEYETLVIDAPMFKKRVQIVKAHNEWDGESGHYVIENAILRDKHAN